MTKMTKVLAATACVAALSVGAVSASFAETVRIAMGDVASVEQLAFMIGLERAKEKGLDYELTVFSKEELAIQALISGQMDVGLGTPYSVIQKSNAPLRVFFQLSKLTFFPVVTSDVQSWADMEGKPITLHSRGGGTDAIASIIEEREGITFGDRSYVPGSENRVIAMLKGQINASIVDIANKNLLLEEGGDKFNVLPMFEVKASDEVMFANQEWLDANQEDVDLLVESMLSAWRDIIADPSVAEKERVRFDLLSDLPQELLGDVEGYYKEAVEGGLFNPEGGGADEAKADFEFYTESGQLEGDPATLKVEDFWDLRALDAAKAKLGG